MRREEIKIMVSHWVDGSALFKIKVDDEPVAAGVIPSTLDYKETLRRILKEIL